MKVDIDRGRIIGAVGEQIRFQVNARGTVHGVSYELAGESIPLLQGEEISITLEREPKYLEFRFDFSGETRGAYEIRVIGSRREYTHAVEQYSTDAPVMLAFGLEGDPDEDL